MEKLTRRQDNILRTLSHSVQSAVSQQILPNQHKAVAEIQKGENIMFSTVSPKVLLVEDTPIIQLVSTKLLTMLGCQVDIAKNGTEAIEMYKNKYDIILMDFDLPDMSGIDATKAIRQLDKDVRTPIVAVTARGRGVEKACFEAGMDDFYVKPVLTEGLAEILKRWLPNHLTH